MSSPRLLLLASLSALVACTTEAPPISGDAGVPSDGGTSADAGVVDPTAALFAADHLIEVNIELSAADWELIRNEGRELTGAFTGCERDYEYTYVRGTVTVDGTSYADVAVRKKGYLGSLSKLRPSLKLNFGRFVEGRTHSGMKRMTLNNNKQDPSNTRQCMAYALFESAGSIAPRCNFARVVVNGEDLGIYTHVESIKKPMIARHFPDNDGNLYEGQGADFIAAHRAEIELKTNEMENDRSDQDRLIAALEVDDDQLLPTLSQAIDIDAFLTFWAMEVMSGHWDSYSGGRNNYLAYNNPENGLFYFIPWGTDGAFTATRPFSPQNGAASVLAEGRIANRLYNHPMGRAMYEMRLRNLFDTVWDEQALIAEADRIGALTDAPEAAINAQRNFLVDHGANLRRELGVPLVDWIDGPQPGPIMCRDDWPTATSGRFNTTWLSNNTPTSAQQSLDIIVNGQPWQPMQLLGGSGVDPANPGAASIRFLSPQPGGDVVVVLLVIPIANIAVGEHDMHGFETNGLVIRLNPRDQSNFAIIGFIGGGSITFDEVDLVLGGTISGSFTGEFLQIRPL